MHSLFSMFWVFQGISLIGVLYKNDTIHKIDFESAVK